MEMPDLIIHGFAGYGLPGLIIMYLLWQLHRRDVECKAEREAKDKAIAAESAARIADSKAATTLALELNEKTHSTIDKLARYAERFERSER